MCLRRLLSTSGPLQRLVLRSGAGGPSSLSQHAEQLISPVAGNTTLTALDITGHCLGDKGAMALGAMLRKNRTLRSLQLDNNYTGLAGFLAIRGALYGNKKIIELPEPSHDIKRLLG